MLKSSFGCCRGPVVAGPAKLTGGVGGSAIESGIAFETAPSAFITVMDALPGFAIDAAGTIALVSVGMSLVGLELGKHLGKGIEDWSEVFSGVILILVGLAVGVGLF